MVKVQVNVKVKCGIKTKVKVKNDLGQNKVQVVNDQVQLKVKNLVRFKLLLLTIKIKFEERSMLKQARLRPLEMSMLG